MNYSDYALIWIYNHALYLLVWQHFFADFICQTSNMALGKSKSNKWLLIHIAAYTSTFFFWGVQFALVNGLSHLVIDYFTSRFSSKMWKRGMEGDPMGYRLFWITIGADQALHVTILLWTASRFLLAF